MRVSRKYTVQGQKVLGVGKSIEATKPRTTTKQKTTTRKSPSQTCVSPAETAKQTAENTTKPKKKGARAQTKTPTESIYRWTQWHIHCITVKNMQNELRIAAVQADMKTIARELTLAWAKLYTKAALQWNLSQSPLRSARHGPSWTW